MSNFPFRKKKIWSLWGNLERIPFSQSRGGMELPTNKLPVFKKTKKVYSPQKNRHITISLKSSFPVSIFSAEKLANLSQAFFPSWEWCRQSFSSCTRNFLFSLFPSVSSLKKNGPQTTFGRHDFIFWADFAQRPLALIWKKCWHFSFSFLDGTPILFYLSKNNCGHSKTWRLHHREEGVGKWKQLMVPQTKEGKFWTSDLMPHTNILEVRGKPIGFFFATLFIQAWDGMWFLICIRVWHIIKNSSIFSSTSRNGGGG